METGIVKQAIVKQTEASFDIITQALDVIPEGAWTEYSNEWSVVSRLYHIIETILFYVRSTPDNFVWGKYIGVTTVMSEEEKQRTFQNAYQELGKRELLKFLDEVKSEFYTAINNVEDMTEMDRFSWFDSILEKLIYLSRHTMFHLGELAKYSRDQNFTHIKWR